MTTRSCILSIALLAAVSCAGTSRAADLAPECAALRAVIAPARVPAGAAGDSTAAIAAVPAGATARPAAARDDLPLASGAATHHMDYMWVVRSTLSDRAKIAGAVEHAREMGLKGLLVQVVGRGDAYYRSDLLPPAASLRLAEFDPLEEVVTRAHAAGLEVHAWMNCMLVWSEAGWPRDRRHVLNTHPEWIARLADGRRMTSLSLRERRRLGVEGVFLAASQPGVGAWLGSIAGEIASRYDVDGIHLDYIRQPDVRLDAVPASSDSPERRAGTGLLAPTATAQAADAAGAPGASRAGDPVADVVRAVRDSLQAVRPGLALSAAVFADTAAAERRLAQPWTSWVRSGLIDRAYVMCYAPAVQTVMTQLVRYALSLGTGGRVVPGIAVFNTPPAAAAAKIRAARALGFPTLALFSYDALAEKPGYWTRLRADLDATPLGASHGRARAAGSMQ